MKQRYANRMVPAGIVCACLLMAFTVQGAQKTPRRNRLQRPIHEQSGIGFSTEAQQDFIEKIRGMEAPQPAQPKPLSRVPLPEGGHDAPGWRVMMYECADQAVGEIIDLFAEEFGSGANLDVLLMHDTPMTTTQIYRVDDTNSLVLLEDWGELDMSDYTTLRDFLLYGAVNYPRDHTMLTIYGHGGAWMGAGGDNTGGYGMLVMDAMKLALQEAGGVDMLTFTAPCLMGNLESAFELRDQVDVYVASPESSNYMLWYGMVADVRNLLNTAPETPYTEIAANMVQWTYENNLGSGNYEEYFTMSAIRTDRLPAVETAMTDLVEMLRNHMSAGFMNMYIARELTEMYGIIDEDFWQLCDIIDFLEEYAALETDPDIQAQLAQTVAALEDAIIDEWHGVLQEGGHGLTIYYPQIGASYLPSYNGSALDFTEATGWIDFLSEYRAQSPPTPTPTASPTVTPPPLPALDLDTADTWQGPDIAPALCIPADFNGDGAVDLAVTLTGPVHRIYRNTGNGFEHTPYWEIAADPSFECTGMAAADLGEDGYADLVLAYVSVSGDGNDEDKDAVDNGATDDVAAPCLLYSNNTGIPDTTPAWSSRDHRTNAIALGDVNTDGIPDLIVGAFGEQDVIYFGTAAGAFETSPGWQTLSHPTMEIALADMNSDGFQELLALDGGGSLRIFWNRNGSLENIDTWTTDPSLTFDARNFDIADWDNDGYPEIAIARLEKSNIVLPNIEGMPSMDPAWVSIACDPTEDVAWGDVDGDGFTELCTGNFNMYWTGSEMFQEAYVDYVYRNNNGHLEAAPFWVSNTMDKTSAAEWFDADGDGDLDLLTVPYDGLPHIYTNRCGCAEPGIELTMPSSVFYSGDPFGLQATLCAATSMPDTPVFIMMEIYGEYFFAPSWCSLNTGIDNFVLDLEPGRTELEVIPQCSCPAVTVPLMGACIYGAMTDPGMTHIIGEMDMWFFSFM